MPDDQILSAEKEAETRAFMLSSIAIATSVFSIAFFYGVFGTIFFENLFYVWVASTVAMVASLFVPPVDGLPALISWRGRFVLLMPSSADALVVFQREPLARYCNAPDGSNGSWLSPSWGCLYPYLILVLIIVAIPDVEQLKQPKLKAAILGICLGDGGVWLCDRHASQPLHHLPRF